MGGERSSKLNSKKMARAAQDCLIPSPPKHLVVFEAPDQMEVLRWREL